MSEYTVIGQTEQVRLDPSDAGQVQEGVLVRWQESQHDYVGTTFVPRRFYPARVRDLVMVDVAARRAAHDSGG